MKKIVLLLVAAALVFTQVAEAKKRVVRSPGGVSIGNSGLMIDASYDPRLDTFVPGYKVINVAIVNQSFDVIMLDPEKDRWFVKLEGEKKAVQAVYDLRGQDPKVWSALPERARGLVAYPLALPIGAQEVLDIFVPGSIDLQKFNELDVYFKSMDTTFEILVRQ